MQADFFLLSEPPEKPKDSLRPHNEQKYVLPNSGITTEGPLEVSRPVGLTQTTLQNNTTTLLLVEEAGLLDIAGERVLGSLLVSAS